MLADAQDKALIFQADANTSLLGAIRQVPAPYSASEDCKIVVYITIVCILQLLEGLARSAKATTCVCMCCCAY